MEHLPILTLATPRRRCFGEERKPKVLTTQPIEQQENPVPRGHHASVKESRAPEQDTGYSGGMTVSLFGTSAVRPWWQRHHHAFHAWRSYRRQMVTAR